MISTTKTHLSPKNTFLLFNLILKLLLVLMLLLMSFFGHAQWMLINQNGGSPHSTAALEISDTTRGLLPPRLTDAQMQNISGAATGLMVYNTDSTSFYYYNGSSWVSFGTIPVPNYAVPAGAILPFGGDTSNIPAGFLLCDNQNNALDTAVYSELFTAIGYAWGGSGATFYKPDLRGRFLRGVALGSGNDPDRSGRTAMAAGGNTGDNVGTVQGDATARPNTNFVTNTTGNHTHVVDIDRGGNENAANNTNKGPYTASTDNPGLRQDVTSRASGNHSHSITGGGDNETRPINAYVNYIICFSSSLAAAGSTSSAFQGSVNASQLPSEAFEDSTRITEADGTAKIEVDGSDNIVFTNSGSESARLASNGNMGIGTNNPTAKLEVAGAIKLDTAVATATAGMMQYKNGGMEYYDGSQWVPLTPAGVVESFAGDTSKIPDGWLLCDGSAVSRTTYARLFSTIGSNWGSGNGSTTFNLPDLRGRFLRGQALNSTNDPDRAGRTAIATGGSTGDNVGSVQSDATSRPNTNFVTNTTGNHTHTQQYRSANSRKSGSSQIFYPDQGGLNGPQTLAAGNHSHSITGGGDNETRPLNAYVVYIIKY